MSVENNLRLSMLKTALFHLLRNYKKSPDRTARNIEELLQIYMQFHPNVQANLPDHNALLVLLETYSREKCLELILHYLD